MGENIPDSISDVRGLSVFYLDFVHADVIYRPYTAGKLIETVSSPPPADLANPTSGTKISHLFSHIDMSNE